ncbi:hypothetical protein D3C86_1933770 [compost metagenome]
MKRIITGTSRVQIVSDFREFVVFAYRRFFSTARGFVKGFANWNTRNHVVHVLLIERSNPNALVWITIDEHDNNFVVDIRRNSPPTIGNL